MNETEITALMAALQPEIADEYRATDDPHDDTPAMQVTIATTDGEDWSYQTGDNSYMGSAYHYRYWGVVSLAREDDPADIARDALEQIYDQMAQDDAYPHICTPQDYRRFREDYALTMDTLTATSTGPAPGCMECQHPHPTPSDPRHDSEPMVLRDTTLVSATVKDRPLRTESDGGELWLYGEEFGPRMLLQADSFESAWELMLDNSPTIPEEDIPEAYGYYSISSNGRSYLCGDEGAPRVFPPFDATHDVIAEFAGTALEAFQRYVDTLPELPDLVEGYEYQPNASGTGIVNVGHYAWLQELTRPLAREYGIAITLDLPDPTEEFSARPCDVCNRQLAGDRSPMHGLDAAGELIHLDACSDCVHYHEFGQLDDATMLEIA